MTFIMDNTHEELLLCIKSTLLGSTFDAGTFPFFSMMICGNCWWNILKYAVSIVIAAVVASLNHELTVIYLSHERITWKHKPTHETQINTWYAWNIGKAQGLHEPHAIYDLNPWMWVSEEDHLIYDVDQLEDMSWSHLSSHSLHLERISVKPGQ